MLSCKCHANVFIIDTQELYLSYSMILLFFDGKCGCFLIRATMHTVYEVQLSEQTITRQNNDSFPNLTLNNKLNPN